MDKRRQRSARAALMIFVVWFAAVSMVLGGSNWPRFGADSRVTSRAAATESGVLRYNRLVSFSAEEEPLGAAIARLARENRLTLVQADPVAGTISVSFSGLTAREAIRALLSGLPYRVIGSGTVFRIEKDETASLSKASPDADQLGSLRDGLAGSSKPLDPLDVIPEPAASNEAAGGAARPEGPAAVAPRPDRSVATIDTAREAAPTETRSHADAVAASTFAARRPAEARREQAAARTAPAKATKLGVFRLFKEPQTDPAASVSDDDRAGSDAAATTDLSLGDRADPGDEPARNAEATPDANAAAPGPLAVGLALLKDGKPREAEASLRQAVEAEPDDPRAHRALGQALLEQRRLFGARSSFKVALELDPTRRDVRNVIRNLDNAIRLASEERDRVMKVGREKGSNRQEVASALARLDNYLR